MSDIRVTVWNEFRHERENEFIGGIYPNGIHGAIAEGLQAHGFTNVRTATLDEPEHGLTEEVLAETDVLTWWGHKAHGVVSDEIVSRVQARVLQGMGLIVLHSGHASKIFQRLMGTSCMLRWREADERERFWVVAPGHPIAQGLGPYFELPEVEMYGELFDIPQPDQLIFMSWFEGGNVFRSGCCFNRGNGKIFYFRPGHETYPIYYNETVRQVIANAVGWAAPVAGPQYPYYSATGRFPAINEREPLEKIEPKHSERDRVG
ncbi:MAG: ThuA domain-containing protein [Caldilineaceae bacterium]|nr:ThuA domain-containing protein [Caldilineaceae bacterium]